MYKKTFFSMAALAFLIISSMSVTAFDIDLQDSFYQTNESTSFIEYDAGEDQVIIGSDGSRIDWFDESGEETDSYDVSGDVRDGVTLGNFLYVGDSGGEVYKIQKDDVSLDDDTDITSETDGTEIDALRLQESEVEGSNNRIAVLVEDDEIVELNRDDLGVEDSYDVDESTASMDSFEEYYYLGKQTEIEKREFVSSSSESSLDTGGEVYDMDVISDSEAWYLTDQLLVEFDPSDMTEENSYSVDGVDSESGIAAADSFVLLTEASDFNDFDSDEARDIYGFRAFNKSTESFEPIPQESDYWLDGFEDGDVYNDPVWTLKNPEAYEVVDDVNLFGDRSLHVSTTTASGSETMSYDAQYAGSLQDGDTVLNTTMRRDTDDGDGDDRNRIMAAADTGSGTEEEFAVSIKTGLEGGIEVSECGGAMGGLLDDGFSGSKWAQVTATYDAADDQYDFTGTTYDSDGDELESDTDSINTCEGDIDKYVHAAQQGVFIEDLNFNPDSQTDTDLDYLQLGGNPSNIDVNEPYAVAGGDNGASHLVQISEESDDSGGSEDEFTYNLIDPEDESNFVTDGDQAEVDFLFEVVVDALESSTEYDLKWTVWGDDGDDVTKKNYDLGEGSTSDEFEETDDLDPGTYTWGLTGTSEVTGESESENYTFTVYDEEDAPFKASLVEPEDGEEVDASDGDKTEIEFEFDIDANETGEYEIDIAQYDDPVVEGNIDEGDNTYTETYEVDNDEAYTWQVDMRDDDDNLTYTSESFDFTVGEVDDDEDGAAGDGSENILAFIWFGALEHLVGLTGEAAEYATAIFWTIVAGGVTASIARSEAVALGSMVTTSVGWALVGYLPGWYVFAFAVVSALIITFIGSKTFGGGST